MTTYIISTQNGKENSFVNNMFINANSPEEAKAMVIAICPTKKILECVVSKTPVAAEKRNTQSLIARIATSLVAKKMERR